MNKYRQRGYETKSVPHVVGDWMSLRSQRRKAMVLSVLMVMLAQSAYSQYYQGWYPPVLEEEPEKKFVNPVVCASETRASGTAINVNQVLGNDS